MDSECLRCAGRGYLVETCPVCDGRGEVDGGRNYCPKCSDGRLYEKCNECDGTGRISHSNYDPYWDD